MPTAPTETDTPDGTRREDEVLDPPIEALSPAEQKLESLRGKLTAQDKDLQKQLEDASAKLPPLLARIRALEEEIIPHLEHAMSGASTAVAEATGAFTGLQRASSLLRDATSETSIVKSLEKGIAEHHERARLLGVQLTGEHEDVIRAFFQNSPVLLKYRHLISVNAEGTDVAYGTKKEIVDDQGKGIDENGHEAVFLDEGRATGLPFEIKNKLRPAVANALAGLKKAIDEHGVGSAQYNEAQDAYRDAEETLKRAVLKKHGLLHEVSRELRLAEGLRDSIEKINLAAGKVEIEMQALRDGNIRRAGEDFSATQREHQAATAELRIKKSEADGLQSALAGWERGREKTRSLLAEMPMVSGALERAEELLANVDNLRTKLLGIERSIDEQVMQAQSGVDDNFTVSEEAQKEIVETAGMWKGIARSDVEKLDLARVRLQSLYGDLEKEIQKANSAETHQQLNGENCERVVEAARELNRFMANEWTGLEGGSEGGIEEIRKTARYMLAEALKPYVTLKMLGGVLETAVEAEDAPGITEAVWSRFCSSMNAAAAHAAENPRPKPEPGSPRVPGPGIDLSPLPASASAPAPADAGPPAPAEPVPPAAAPAGESVPAEAEVAAAPPAPAPPEEGEPRPKKPGETQPLPRRRGRGAEEE